ncbi:MAG: stage III sporulation protein AG [Oscillospiraceae bacterium]|nr:stage III sporulation protein AG [Oscillospiraceae bacterium]
MNEKKARSPVDVTKFLKVIEKNKYVCLVLLLGVVILIWPFGGGTAPTAAAPPQTPAEHPLAFSLEEKEARLAYALSQIEGAGEVIVMLSLRTSLEQEVAVDEDQSGRRATVTISTGAGTQSEVTLRYRYPEFQGALIVSEGAHNATVRLQLTQAVAALTGLGTDRITVTPMRVIEEDRND